MSVVFSASEGYVICHKLFIKNIYREVHEEEAVFSLVFNKGVFKIESPFDEKNSPSSGVPRKKIKCSSGEPLHIQTPEINQLCKTFWSLLHKARAEGHLQEKVFDSLSKNGEAKEIADQFYKESSKHVKTYFHGCNNLNNPVIQTFNNEQYVFPSNCKFFCQDVDKLNEILVPCETKFDFIVLDPPWWNKYIRRKKSKCTEASYEMMYNENLKNLPIAQLATSNALLAVWCTNSKQNINALLNDVFGAWGVKYAGTWTWLKVTNSGDPICTFADPPKKQPYERIIFAYNPSRSPAYPLPEDGKMIISVPSAIHSHKPPLSEVVSSYLPSDPNCLELFARYLLPNWTSLGNEVLKLQHASLYERYDSSLL